MFDVFRQLHPPEQTISFTRFDQRSIGQLVSKRLLNAGGYECLEVILQSQKSVCS